MGTYMAELVVQKRPKPAIKVWTLVRQLAKGYQQNFTELDSDKNWLSWVGSIPQPWSHLCKAAAASTRRQIWTPRWHCVTQSKH